MVSIHYERAKFVQIPKVEIFQLSFTAFFPSKNAWNSILFDVTYIFAVALKNGEWKPRLIQPSRACIFVVHVFAGEHADVLFIPGAQLMYREKRFFMFYETTIPRRN